MSTEDEGADVDLSPVEVDRSPTALSSIAAVGAALLAGVTSAPFSLLALPLGIGGVAMIAAGVYSVERRSWVTLGSAGLFLSVLVAGGFGAPVEFLLVSTAGTVLAWDFGQTAITLGRQMGRHTSTQRNEMVHASVSTVVVLLSAGVGYVAYSVASGGRPVAGLTVLLFGIVFLVWTIRT